MTPGPAWDPLAQPRLEADTLFLPDLASWETIDAEGGFLANNAAAPSATVASNFEFGPGRFGPAVRGKPGSTNYVFYPMDGLIPSDEWTIEFWAKADRPWADLAPGVPIFALAGESNRIEFTPRDGQCDVVAQSLPKLANVPGASARVLRTSCDALGLSAGAWHGVAMTFKEGRLDVYVDARRAGTLEDMRWLPVWSDTTRSDGVQLSGQQGQSANVWISDVRISRTARVPGRSVPLRSLKGAISVDTRSVRSPIPDNLVGALHPGNAEPAAVRAAVDTVRTDKLIQSTPIVRGQPDGDHPTRGKTGRFSYDWQVVDRTFAWLAASGVAGAISLDATPQVLGGSVPPYRHNGPRGQNLDTDLSATAAFSATPPDNLDDWSAIVTDLVHHVKEKRYAVASWSVWNEPDAAEFWAGTQQQYLDLYAVTARAVRSVDPGAKVGAGELATLNLDWLGKILARASQERLPLDFVAVHDYTGSLGTLEMARAAVDEQARRAGFPTPFPIFVSEFNWTLDNVYQPGCMRRFCQGFWHLRSLNAAYTTAYLIRMVELSGFGSLIYSHLESAASYGDIRANGGFAVMQLLSADGRQWAPYNALVGWKRAVGAHRLSTAQELPPGVHALASTNSPGTQVGMAFSNYGWSQRQARAVGVRVDGLAAGTYVLRRFLVDESHSSRWDALEDRLGDDSADGLEMVEQRSIRVSGDLTFDVELPRWSSTFITLDREAP